MSFDFEHVDELAMAGGAGTTVSGTAGPGKLLSSKVNRRAWTAADRRLMLLFFDFSAMQPDDIDRAVDAGKKYVKAKMQPADLVALMSLATNLSLDLDFSDDKSKILAKLSAYNSSEGQGFENGSTGSSEGAAETSGSYTAGRHGLQHVQRGPEVAGVAVGNAGDGKDPAEKKFDLFQQWDHAVRRG